MKSINQLCCKLEQLSFELNCSGKIQTAFFFENVKNNLQSSNGSGKLKNILEDDLIHSGAISQYANFSVKEDELFDHVWEEANKILLSL